LLEGDLFLPEDHLKRTYCGLFPVVVSEGEVKTKVVPTYIVISNGPFDFSEYDVNQFSSEDDLGFNEIVLEND
jgi:hypothetical protein